MTLRWARLVVVPMSGPRSAAVGAPQQIGGASKPRLCEVRRIWPEALFDFAGDGTAAPVSADMFVLRQECASISTPRCRRSCCRHRTCRRPGSNLEIPDQFGDNATRRQIILVPSQDAAGGPPR